MEQLNNLDVVFLIIVGISALVGIARGMTKEVLSIIGWILVAAALFYLVPVCEPAMQKHIASKIMADIVAGLAILIVFSIIWVLTVDKIASTIRSSTLSALDRILGFVFGAARGVIIVILIALMISTLIPEESKEGMFAESQYFKLAKANAEPLMNLVPQSWIDSVKEKSESLGFGKAKENEKEAEKAQKDDEKASEQKNEKSQATDKKENSASEEGKDKLGQTLENNLQVLKKSGEELFNDLVQPKTAGENEGEGENIEPDSSDLDRLLDVLEDRMVTTDTPTETVVETKETVTISEDKSVSSGDNAASAGKGTPTLTDKVIEKVTEKVAEKIADKVAPKNTPAQ